MEKMKQSKIATHLITLIASIISYLAAGFVLIILAGPLIDFKRTVIFSFNDLFLSSLLFLLAFLGFYFLVYKKPGKKKWKKAQRITLYSLFLGFSAFPILLAILFMSRVEWNIFYAGIASFITYTFFTFAIEVKKIKNFIRQLIYWTLATIIAGKCALLIMEWNYTCTIKYLGKGSGYIAEQCSYLLSSIPGITILILVTLFTILNFTIFSKKSHKK